MSTKEIDTGVLLPEDGTAVDTDWARDQLERTDAFSKELMFFGKGSVFFLLKTNLSPDGYAQSVADLGYAVETANLYISYLQKRPVLEAIKAKFYVAISLSASEYIPDAEDDAMALLDVCVAKYGKFTADNLRKAAEDTGTLPKKMSSAAISVEAMKKKALHDWLADTFDMSEDDIYQAAKVSTEGRTEFTEKMADAFDRIEDWEVFYKVIATVVHKSENIAALRFLADFRDAAPSMAEYLASEKANHLLTARIEKFENEVYPELSFQEAAQ